MKKLLFLLLALLVISSTALARNVMPIKPLAEIDLYGINDFHGHITGSTTEPGALRLAGTREGLLKQNPYGTAFFGGGNNMAGFDDNDKRMGDPTIMMLNALGISATVPGASDFQYQAYQIANQAASSYYAYLAANIVDANGNTASPFKPYLLFNRAGAGIGVIGLVGQDVAAPAAARGYKVVPAAQVTQQCVNELRNNGAQIVVLLTSLKGEGIGDKKITGEITALLDKVTGVDAVFLAGTGKEVRGTYKNIPVVAAAPFGTQLAQIHFLYNRIDKKVLVGVAKTVDVMALPSEVDKKLEKTYTRLMSGTGARLGTMTPSYVPTGKQNKKEKQSIYQNVNGSVNEAPQPATKGAKLADNLTTLTNYPGGQSTLGEFFTDMVRQAYNCDVVLYPGSSFKYSIPAGSIYEGTITSVMPYKDSIVVGQMTGSQIRTILEHGLNPGVGLIRFSGLRIAAHINNPEGSRLGSVEMLNGQNLRNDAVYTVAVSSRMLEGADGYNLSYLTNAGNKGPAQDFFKFFLRYAKTLDYKGDGRLKF
ncbi:MAG: 5-nucleotid-C domain-containing protein [Succiniclasticum sp.]|jgi:2',3'-cyclic-nucleotide 2'-phosphodiesterase (5'-nucleotidase family)